MTEQFPLTLTEPDFRHDTVVSLRNTVEQGGLSGKRVVITRAVHQSETLANLLRQANAIPFFYPCIDIAPPEDSTLLDEALRNLVAFDWLILTSANTVHVIASRLDALGLPLSVLGHLRVAAVGPTTAKVARGTLGVEAIVPSPANSDEYNAEALARHLSLSSGQRVLLPQSEIASPALAEALAGQGADVQTVTAYRTVRGSGGDPIPQLLTRGEVDAIIFTSGSTVQYFLERLAADGGSKSHLMGVTIACIGESTAQAARDLGLAVTVIPSSSTLSALVRSLEAHFDVR